MQRRFTDATLYTRGKLSKGGVALSQGRVVDFSSPAQGDGVPRVTPLNGKLLIPGLVDVHVHLREPGFSYKETIAAGSRAGARGGYTALCAMPNLNPAPDSLEHVKVQQDIIDRDACIRVYPYASITLGQKGRGGLVDFAALAPKVVAFSDDGRGVQDEEAMREAMGRVKAVNGLLVAHCEDESLLEGGYIHKGSYARAHGHRGISSESEWRQVQRDLALARETGCRYHVCHVSTKESVALIRRAKREGVDVSCETAPHYLLLQEDWLQEDGNWKMNPPIREEADRMALLEGLSDGTVDIIATDHAPHSAQEKSGGLEGSANGIVGLECAFAVLYTGLVKAGKLPLERLLAAMTDAPRRRFGLPPVTLEPGQSADIAIFDLGAKGTVNPEEFASLGRATPFAGMEVWGRCECTLVEGEEVWLRR
ncbi:MAG: dihydroorotase [Candidatus Limiplasma sp.]|nr:dihydroorotase [Candidatus Limiplasma sp.]